MYIYKYFTLLSQCIFLRKGVWQQKRNCGAAGNGFGLGRIHYLVGATVVPIPTPIYSDSLQMGKRSRLASAKYKLMPLSERCRCTRGQIYCTVSIQHCKHVQRQVFK